MRRVMMLLAAMAVMVTLFAAVAYAATIVGTDHGELLYESSLNDTVFGRGGADNISAIDFSDDRDVAYGNSGSDTITVDDGDGLDTINGGNAFDACIGDPGDKFISCEEERIEE